MLSFPLPIAPVRSSTMRCQKADIEFLVSLVSKHSDCHLDVLMKGLIQAKKVQPKVGVDDSQLLIRKQMTYYVQLHLIANMISSHRIPFKSDTSSLRFALASLFLFLLDYTCFMTLFEISHHSNIICRLGDCCG
jgi:hypothetical protein